MTGRERVMKTLNFENTSAIDLGGMLSTGISCFAYPHLVETLGLPSRLPKVHDTMQMLALPDIDVLDVLNCDVVSVCGDSWTNAFEEPGKWQRDHGDHCGSTLGPRIVYAGFLYVALRCDNNYRCAGRHGWIGDGLLIDGCLNLHGCPTGFCIARFAGSSG